MCWRDDAHELAVEFDPSIPPEAANERLLPALFAFGVIAVSSGRTLEQACLGR